MVFTFLTWVIVGLVALDISIDYILDYLNYNSGKKPIPNELSGVYDDKQYEKQQRYDKDNYIFGLYSGTFSHIITFTFLFFGYAYLDSFSRILTSNPILSGLVFFGIVYLISDILSTPFDIYDTFVIESKYGFNTTTVKTYILDKIKSGLLLVVIGGGLLSLVIWLITILGSDFWFYAFAVITLFSIIMLMFYSTIIVPLFNKQTPLEEGDLKNAINKMCQQANFKLDNVFVIDGSKRSTKANAYFTGIGKKKRIVLYDTLIKELSTPEIVAVLAHEIGHYKHKHVYMTIGIGMLGTALTLFTLGLCVESPLLPAALGVTGKSIPLSLIVFSILYEPISFIIGILTSLMSRKNEYQADRFAAMHSNSDDLISALKKLSSSSLSNLTPHPLYVFLKYSHPTLLQRVNSLKK